MTNKIPWTGKTFTCGVYGCTLASAGCFNCYSMGMAARLANMADASGNPNHRGHRYAGLTTKRDRGAVWSGKVLCNEAWMVQEFAELPKRKPTKVFLSMADLFHHQVPDAFIVKALNLMLEHPHCLFQILTKRATRMAEIMERLRVKDGTGNERTTLFESAPTQLVLAKEPVLPRYQPKLVNVHVGVSIENQKQLELRLPELSRITCATTFASFEPLLEPLTIRPLLWSTMPPDTALGRHERVPLGALHWGIIGGESGNGAREMRPEWAIELLQDLRAAGIPVFVKQMGAHWAKRWWMKGTMMPVAKEDPKGADMEHWPEVLRVQQFPVDLDEKWLNG